MDDDELISAYISGDQRAGDTLARRYYRALRRYYQTRVPSDEVEELTQSTLLHTIARGERFRHASSFRHYVYAVARRILAERHRRRYRSPVTEGSPPDAPAPGTSPSEQVFRSQRRAQLELALRDLKDPFLSVMNLHLAGLDNREIAGTLGLNDNTVRSRLSRATSVLRTALTGEPPSP